MSTHNRSTQNIDVLKERDQFKAQQPALVQSYEQFLHSFGRYCEMKKQFDVHPGSTTQFKAEDIQKP